MRNLIVLSLLLVVLLAACASPAAPSASPSVTEIGAVVTEPSAPPPTQPPAPTQPPPTETAPEPTAAPAAAPTEAPAQEPGAAGTVVYKIVPGETSVTYEVGETFFNQNNRFSVAVGKTTEVNGEVSVDTLNPQNSQVGPIQIDISRFQSDSGRRDNYIRQNFLESNRFPIATFTPTEVNGLPDTYSEGQDLNFTVTGDLTIKETTKPVTFEVSAKVANGALSGVATTMILMSDFAVGPVELLGMLKTEDQVKLTLNFVARP